MDDYQEAPQEFFEEVAEKLEGIKALVQKVRPRRPMGLLLYRWYLHQGR